MLGRKCKAHLRNKTSMWKTVYGKYNEYFTISRPLCDSFQSASTVHFLTGLIK